MLTCALTKQPFADGEKAVILFITENDAYRYGLRLHNAWYITLLCPPLYGRVVKNAIESVSGWADVSAWLNEHGENSALSKEKCLSALLRGRLTLNNGEKQWPVFPLFIKQSAFTAACGLLSEKRSLLKLLTREQDWESVTELVHITASPDIYGTQADPETEEKALETALVLNHTAWHLTMPLIPYMRFSEDTELSRLMRECLL